MQKYPQIAKLDDIYLEGTEPQKLDFFKKSGWKVSDKSMIRILTELALYQRQKDSFDKELRKSNTHIENLEAEIFKLKQTMLKEKYKKATEYGRQEVMVRAEID